MTPLDQYRALTPVDPDADMPTIQIAAAECMRLQRIIRLLAGQLRETQRAVREHVSPVLADQHGALLSEVQQEFGE